MQVGRHRWPVAGGCRSGRSGSTSRAVMSSPIKRPRSSKSWMSADVRPAATASTPWVRTLASSPSSLGFGGGVAWSERSAGCSACASVRARVTSACVPVAPSHRDRAAYARSHAACAASASFDAVPASRAMSRSARPRARSVADAVRASADLGSRIRARPNHRVDARGPARPGRGTVSAQRAACPAPTQGKRTLRVIPAGGCPRQGGAAAIAA